MWRRSNLSRSRNLTRNILRSSARRCIWAGPGKLRSHPGANWRHLPSAENRSKSDGERRWPSSAADGHRCLRPLRMRPGLGEGVQSLRDSALRVLHGVLSRGVMKPGTALMLVLLLLAAIPASAAETHAISGVVLKVDAAHKSMTVSCQSVPGYMDAMTMPFAVRDAKILDGINPGANIDFTLVVNGDSSYAEN